MTNLRDCFDTLPETHTIRLKGTRIGWEHVVQLFQQGLAPEEIATHFADPLPIEQVYAAITYYMLNRTEYEEYVRRGDEIARELQEKYWESLTPEQRDEQTAMRQRLRDLKARFTDDHGRLDVAGLKAHVEAERAQAAGAGS